MDSQFSSSSVKIIFQTSPYKTLNFPSKPFLATIFVFLILHVDSALSDADFESLYDRHCGHVVPRSTLSSSAGVPPSDLSSGYFRGGAPVFNQTLASGVRFLSFKPFTDRSSIAGGLYGFGAALSLTEASSVAIAGDSGGPQSRGARIAILRSRFSFNLRGFWSENSREVCMIGDGSVKITGKLRSHRRSVVLKLRYPHNSTIYHSLVRGSLESTDGRDSESYFEPVSMLAVAQDSSHEYTLVGKDGGGISGCMSGDYGGESIRVSALPNNGCSVLRGTERFELDCEGFGCDFLGGVLGFVPSYMVFYRTQCGAGKKWQMLLGFPDSDYKHFRSPFDLRTTIVVEGTWNEKEDRFCAVGCQVLNFTESFENAYVGNCSTGFSLRFPASLSLRNRDNIAGKIWSFGTVDSSGQVGEIGFSGFRKRLMSSFGTKYEFTAINALRKTCKISNSPRGKGKKYPSAYSMDMTFDMTVKDRKGLNAMGYSSPFFIGSLANRNLYWGLPRLTETEFSVMSNDSLGGGLVNISYDISFTLPTDFKFDNSSSREVKISAEGIYNRDNGVLCMMGCRSLASKAQNSATNNTLDCEIMINVQFSPLDAKTNKDVKGTIESTRQMSDPLYFEQLELSSNTLYIGQAKESIWRMDLEITMVLISKTLTCLFVGLQLFYMKSHPEVLPFASVMMLLVLTVGHMIPLVLNFEALFTSHRNLQNDVLGSGGWLEANEVIVRIITMLAFLLQLRLLHLTWSSRKGEANDKLWKSERKVLYLTIPLYISGALIAWFVNHMKNTRGVSIRAFRHPRRMTYVVTPFHRRTVPQHSLWKDLKSYAGLVMDGFLLPQALFNVFADSGEKALAPPFYAGTTFVRLLPHVYDLYRARNYSPFLDLSYIYASHRMDFYSTAWDVVIPLAGLLFVALIFLQQRLGGRCILPRRFRQSQAYEKVPMISNDNL